MWTLTVVVLCLAVTFGHADDCSERDLTGKKVVITGAAQGIGYAIADNFLKNNVSRIIIVDKNQTEGEKATANLNCKYGHDKVVFYHADITTDVDTISTDILDRCYVDVLINNAGVCDEYNPKYMIEVNLLGTIQWTLRFYNVMRKDKNGIGGSIINISSKSGYSKDPLIPVYKSTKAGVLGYTYGLGHQYTYKSTGVRVCAICPGLTYTAMTAAQVVIDEQKNIWSKFKAANVWQEADHVGKCSVDVFKNADSGTAWTIEENKPAFIAPASRYLPVSTLEAL